MEVDRRKWIVLQRSSRGGDGSFDKFENVGWYLTIGLYIGVFHQYAKNKLKMSNTNFLL